MPADRCIMINDGRGVYKQLNGDNYLYYYNAKGMWVIDRTDEKEPKHEGLRVFDRAGRPEDIQNTWQAASTSGFGAATFRDSTDIFAACGAKLDSEIPPTPDYEVYTMIQVGGYTVATFGWKQQDFLACYF